MASIPNRYAKALYQLVGSDLAKARKLRESFDGINQLFEMKDSARVLRSPVMPPDLKRKLLDYAMDATGAAPEVKQLTTALLAAGRADLLPEVAKSFAALLDQADGVVKADVAAAVALNAADAKAIGDALSQLLAKKVEVKPTVDPSLLGGFVATVGNYRVDMSLRTKLDGLSQSAVQDSIR